MITYIFFDFVEERELDYVLDLVLIWVDAQSTEVRVT